VILSVGIIANRQDSRRLLREAPRCTANNPADRYSVMVH